MKTFNLISKKITDTIFISASLVFNISVSIVYIAVKFENHLLLQISGAVSISLILPFTFTMLGYLKEKAGKKILISHIFILFYLVLEILLDYILKIPFREILAIHIPYIIFFYAAVFNMIVISFKINKKMGWVVTASFIVLIGCLIYMYS